MDHELARLRAIFDEVIQSPPDSRAALLAKRCGDDPALRRRVEALIATAEADEPFLSEPTRTNPPFEKLIELTPVTLSEGPGTRIGPYKLLQKIGEGGFGVVFMAEQDQPVRRRVALKIIKLGMDTRQVVARFEQERQALALMDHPNIARVFDAGATDSGRPYFVMEYVKGDPITDFADAHKLSVRQRLDLLAQVCTAVQHAHTKGVIHRDIKPRNVLVSMVDGKPFAKVIDFGIAKATGARLTDKTLFTEHRQLIGTPEYMSPEQAEGSPDIDTRTDVYALGVLLYELLTGATPFDAARLRSAAYAEMQRIIKEEEPPMPSLRLWRATASPPPLPLGEGRGEGYHQRTQPVQHAEDRGHSTASPLDKGGLRGVRNEPRTSVRADAQPPLPLGEGRGEGQEPRASSIHPGAVSLTSSPEPEAQSTGLAIIARLRSTEPLILRKLIKGELDWIVMKSLDKDRARRYETPNQLAADVQRHLSGEPVLAAPPSAAYRLRKFIRKHKSEAVATSFVLLVLIGGITATSWKARQLRAANAKLLDQHDRAKNGVEEMFGILTDGELGAPDYRVDDNGVRHKYETASDQWASEYNPLEYTVKMGIMFAKELRAANKKLEKTAIELEAANEGLAAQRDIAIAIVKQALGDARKKGGFKVQLDGGKTLLVFSPNGDVSALESMQEEVAEDFVGPPRRVGYRKQAVDTNRLIYFLGEAITQSIDKLREEVKRARLAEASVLYAVWKERMWNIADGGYDAEIEIALQHLTSVASTRSELLGSNDIDTIKALWWVEETHRVIDMNARHEVFDELAVQLDRANVLADKELAYMYRREFERCLHDVDIDHGLRWIDRIARALPEIVEVEGDRVYGLYATIWESHLSKEPFEESTKQLPAFSGSELLERAAWEWTGNYPARPDMVSVEDAKPRWQRIVETANTMLRANSQDQHALTALAAAQRVLENPLAALETARKAQVVRAASGLREDPTDLAIISMSLFELGRIDEAQAALSQLRELCANYSGSRNYAASRLSAAEQLIDPKPSTEQQLAEQTKKRRLAESEVLLIKAQVGIKPFPSEDERERYLAQAHELRREVFGKDDPKTLVAEFWLTCDQIETDPTRLSYIFERLEKSDEVDWLPEMRPCFIVGLAAHGHFRQAYAQQQILDKESSGHIKIGVLDFSLQAATKAFLTDSHVLNLGPEGQQFYLTELQSEAEVEPDDPRIVCAFALIHYRLRNYTDAIAASAKAADFYASQNLCPQFGCLAITAMSHLKLGDVANAREEFAQLRNLMSDPIFADAEDWDTADSKALLAEAEALIEPKTDPPASP